MNKKFPIALAASLLLTSGASTAFAATGSGDTTTTSTTVPATSGKTKPTSAQRDARKAALTKYLETKNAILTTFQNAKVDALKAFKVSFEAATSPDARKAAIRVRNEAFKTATETKNAAFAALGAPPANP